MMPDRPDEGNECQHLPISDDDANTELQPELREEPQYEEFLQNKPSVKEPDFEAIEGEGLLMEDVNDIEVTSPNK